MEINEEIKNEQNSTSNVEELLKQIDDYKETIANLEKVNSKQKESLDKASSEVAAFKKKERESKSNDEINKSFTEELQARIETLEREKKEASFKSFLSKHEVDEEIVTNLMESYFSQNVEGFGASLNSMLEKIVEKTTKETTLEKLTNTKRPSKSEQDSDVITKEKFNKMGYQARLKLATENPTLYKELTK